MSSDPEHRKHIEALWQRYSERLHGFIRRRVSDDHDTEDLLQEVFVRIHQGLCSLSRWGALESWVFTIARNLVTDYHRRRKTFAELPEELPAEPSPELEPAARLALSLREMVEDLPEPHREALLLTEYEGLAQAELAARAGISLSAAKSRVQRARRKLREMLLACCHFELDRHGRIIDYYKRCCCAR